MSTAIIDALARRTATLSRRTALGVALSGLIGSSLAVGSEAKGTGQRRKRRKRKNRNKNNAEANAFGCLNVGDRCDGTDLQCCSGICQKQKGGKGKDDKSFCVAHDEGSCRPDQDSCVDEDVAATQCDVDGVCFRTTGQAGFCGRVISGACLPCRKDADCAAFGDGSACVVCAQCEDESGGTGCVPPATGQLPS